MKSLRYTLCIAAVFLATATFAESDAQKSFAQLKSLAGSWQGKNSMGEPVKVSYRPTAGGSALLSEIDGKGEDMITMFHLDGSRLLMTHYCAAGNQPRMVATVSSDGKTVTFNFLDATNLDSPQSGHMHHVVFTIVDANHHNEEWDFLKDGKELRETFNLTRTN